MTCVISLVTCGTIRTVIFMAVVLRGATMEQVGRRLAEEGVAPYSLVED